MDRIAISGRDKSVESMGIHVLVAVPGRHHLDSLAPLFSALGEPVVPVATDALAARRVSGSVILDAFRSALERQDGPAVFPTTFAPPWAIFDALLGEAADRRALVFYESSNLGVARLLQSGARTLEACDIWLREAKSLVEFVRANSRHVTLVRVDKALMAPRSLLSACAERFLYDLVDTTARPGMSSLPPLLFRLVAEFAARQEPALRALDDQLDNLAFVPDAGPETEPGELDRFIADYQVLKDSHQALGRVQAEANALRTANRLAEESAQALRAQLADLEARLSSATKRQSYSEDPAGTQQNCIAVLEEDVERLRGALGDVQLIAETHVAESAALRERLHRDARRLAKLEAELSGIETRMSDAEDAEAGSGEDAPSLAVPNGNDDVSTSRRTLRERFRPGRWLRARRDVRLVGQSEYFDATWYTERNPDVQRLGADPAKHFVRHGGQEGRDPSLTFSSRRYLEENPDVARAGLNPLVHYLRLGRVEGRKIHRADKA